MRTLQQIRYVALTSAVALALVFCSTGSLAQTDLENALKQFTGDAVKGYIQPIGDLFGANMNAGLFRTAEIPTTGFNLSFNIIAMAAPVSDDQQVYDAVLPPGFTPVGGSRKSATVFGGKGTVFTDATTGLQYRGTDGILNASMFPLAVPQLNIGSIFGTQVIVRYVSDFGLLPDDLPKITLFGIGARHNISQYLPMIPLDLAAGVFYSNFKFGDIIEFTGLSFGAQASKKFSILTLYSGVAIEKSKMQITFNYTIPAQGTLPARPGSIDVTLDGANAFRFTAGASLNLFLFKVFADVNLGSVTHYSGGIGFGF